MYEKGFQVFLEIRDVIHMEKKEAISFIKDNAQSIVTIESAQEVCKAFGMELVECKVNAKLSKDGTSEEVAMVKLDKDGCNYAEHIICGHPNAKAVSVSSMSIGIVKLLGKKPCETSPMLGYGSHHRWVGEKNAQILSGEVVGG